MFMLLLLLFSLFSLFSLLLSGKSEEELRAGHLSGGPVMIVDHTIMMIIIIVINHNDNDNDNDKHNDKHNSGGRLCTLIGVPCRISMLSTFSTFANVLF